MHFRSDQQTTSNLGVSKRRAEQCHQLHFPHRSPLIFQGFYFPFPLAALLSPIISHDTDFRTRPLSLSLSIFPPTHL